ncbi:VCBS repeat-containing protein [Microbacterium esteraromaticum]|nr:VCBS repeat-containing protein [Microbacterium esteraromaticum]
MPVAAPAPAVAGLAAGPVKTSLVGWNAGNIISDAVFTNEATMTESQIQSFFNSKVSTCRGGSDQYGPIICLKDFRIDSVSMPADKYCKGYTGARNESAARIIYRVSQACDINPQVLIVMLQKEQGLVTHTWPSKWRYDIALGQGCPDTAPCDPKFVGFFHQIYGAARQMQLYMEGRYFTWYAPGKTWNVLYHPNSACGTAPVKIVNKATSALYYYTPYQPNAAALRAGYGTGDSCSSYGNRNFYNYFTDWFGSTQVPAPEPEPEPEPEPGLPLESIDHSDFMVGLDSSGRVWGYAFEDGEFGEKRQLAEGLDQFRGVFSLGDFTGSGYRDFVGISGNGTAWLFTSNGESLRAPQRLADQWADAVLVAPAGDFNGDGVPDVFTTSKDGTLWLWPGRQGGTFGTRSKVGSGWHVVDLLAGGYDMNGDGVPDLVARWSDGKLITYLGSGSGGWRGTIRAGHGWQSMDKITVVGNFVGTGAADILASDADGVLKSYPGIGDGRVRSGDLVGSGWHRMVSAAGAGAPAAPLQAGAGDIDRDGARDVLGLTETGELRLYRGAGNGRFAGVKTLDPGWSGDDLLLPMGDFDGDGMSDIARIRADGELRLHSGDGVAYGAGRKIGHGWRSVDVILSGVDFDGDHVPDVLARNADGTLTLYPGDGHGGWSADRPRIAEDWNDVKSAFYSGDFDGDGRPDALVRKTNGTLWLFPILGDGTWGKPRQVGHGWDRMTAVLSPGDFNGDGAPDVLARDAAGSLLLYRGDGRGGWLGSQVVGAKWNVISQIR